MKAVLSEMRPLSGFTHSAVSTPRWAVLPSLTHLIKVIIVVMVLLLSPVVAEAGLGWEHALIGRDDAPCVTIFPVCACAQAQRPLSSDILFTPETQDGSCECLGPIAN